MPQILEERNDCTIPSRGCAVATFYNYQAYRGTARARLESLGLHQREKEMTYILQLFFCLFVLFYSEEQGTAAVRPSFSWRAL